MRRLRRRWGRRVEPGEMASGDGIGESLVAAWLVIVVSRGSRGSSVAPTCSSKLFGWAAMPLAEKYSLRKSFRRIGLGAAPIGACLSEDTVRCRFAWVSKAPESRARHLKHTEPFGGKCDATRFGRRSIPGGERYHILVATGMWSDGSISDSAGVLDCLRNTDASIAGLRFDVSLRSPKVAPNRAP